MLRDRLVAIVGLSMAATPLLVIAVSRWLPKHPETQGRTRPADAIDHENPRVIIAGFGRMGQIVGRMLRAQRIPFTALEHSVEQVELSRRFGTMIYYGDPTRPDLLRAAHAERAEVFVLTTDDPETTVRTARLLKRQYPHLKVFARARNRQHAFKLMDLGVEVDRARDLPLRAWRWASRCSRRWACRRTWRASGASASASTTNRCCASSTWCTTTRRR